MGLNEKAREFAASVKGTREFAELKKAKGQINKNKELKSKVDEFMQQQAEVFSSKRPVKELEAMVADINKKFQNLSKEPEFKKFIDAGKEFNNLMANAYKIINESIEKELQ